MQRYPRRWATRASPMPVLPLVGSTIVPPGFSRPASSAASTMRTAMRSLTEPPGLTNSTFASTSGASGPRSRVTLLSRTSGVPPIRSRTDSAYCTSGASSGARWVGLIPSDAGPMSLACPRRSRGMSESTVVRITEGYAPVNGVQMYWRSIGEGGTPLVLVHGGFGTADTWGGLLEELAERRRVIAVELQGHGRTADINRPFRCESFGDDLAALIGHLQLGQADLLGYSLGAGAAPRAAIRHPEAVRRLVVVSTAFRRDGWFPAVLQGMDQVGR